MLKHDEWTDLYMHLRPVRLGNILLYVMRHVVDECSVGIVRYYDLVEQQSAHGCILRSAGVKMKRIYRLCTVFGGNDTWKSTARTELQDCPVLIKLRVLVQVRRERSRSVPSIGQGERSPHMLYTQVG